MFSRPAYNLQVRATSHSATCGHPGYVPDDYLEHLNGLGVETTITAAELCAIGTSERVGGGYRILDWEAVEYALDQVRQLTGEDPRALAADQEHQAKIQACMAKPMVITPPCAACEAPSAHIELLAPGQEPAGCDQWPGTMQGSFLRRPEPGQWYLLIKGTGRATVTDAPSMPVAPDRSPGRSGIPCASPRSAPPGSTTMQDSAQIAKSRTATSTSACPTLDTATGPTGTARAWTRTGIQQPSCVTSSDGLTISV